jgi:hypothetical protein
MLPKPDVGQLVRLETYDGRLIVKRVSDDGGRVDLVSETDPNLTTQRRTLPGPVADRRLLGGLNA